MVQNFSFMDNQVLYQALCQNFEHQPTEGQQAVLQDISNFLSDSNGANSVFILKGFAGTGKTSIISSVVKLLKQTRIKTILLAPTGRAAKVISEYSKEKAYTIHKYIYYPKTKNDGVLFSLKNNKNSRTLFIVDEASMIADRNLPNEQSVLEDLISFVYSGKNCKLILVGDTAQLPPVNMDISPALSEDFLTFEYNKSVQSNELTQVVRQKKKSGILRNATHIRQKLSRGDLSNFNFKLNPYKDIIRIEGAEILEALQDSYRIFGVEQTAFLVHSNKRATLYNQQIRKVVFDNEDVLSVGDLLMVVKNNYFWLNPNSEAGFIANGDTIQVIEIHRFEELYGFRFAEVKVQMIDYPEQPAFDTMLLLDTIESFSASLTQQESNQLYQNVLQSYQNETSHYRRYLKMKNDPFFNALQVKFSYAITCHKSQGGQWDIVFLEKPYLPNGISVNYLRWLYTAITRAKKRLYLVGFPTSDFEDFW